MTDVALAKNVYGEWNRERIDLIKNTYCKGATDDELSLFVSTCQRLGLSPEARQVFAVKRWDNVLKKEVMSIQVSIDGLRLAAERSGKYAGQQGPFWCSEDGKWRDVWLSKAAPAAAKVGILRDGFKEPLWGIATWQSYCQTTKDGSANAMWRKMGDIMLAKCAEAMALRKAFPQELNGIYTTDEMDQAESQQTLAPYEEVTPRGRLADAVKASQGKWSHKQVEDAYAMRGHQWPPASVSHWDGLIEMVESKSPEEVLNVIP